MSRLKSLYYRLFEIFFSGYATYQQNLVKDQLAILKDSVQWFNAETEKYRRNNALLQSYQKDLMDAYSKINETPTVGLE